MASVSNLDQTKPVRFYSSLDDYYGNRYTDTTVARLYDEKVATPQRNFQFDINESRSVIEHIDSCQSKQSINELFYTLFNREKKYVPLKKYLLISNLDENFGLGDYRLLAKKVYQEWIGTMETPGRREVTELREFQFSQDTVYCTHGGGERFILSFLQGFERGYPMLTSGQKAIYVSPSEDQLFAINSGEKRLNDRDEFYAYQSPYWEHFDTPAILKFKTERSFLQQENRGYEACLTSDNISNIEDIELIALKDRNKLLLKMPVVSLYSRNTKERTSFAYGVDQSIERIKKQAMSQTRQDTQLFV